MAKKAVEATHGGKRENAGRKLDYDAPKQIKSINVSPEFAAFMGSLSSASKFIEDTVRKSKAFKTWKASQSGK